MSMVRLRPGGGHLAGCKDGHFHVYTFVRIFAHSWESSWVCSSGIHARFWEIHGLHRRFPWFSSLGWEQKGVKP